MQHRSQAHAGTPPTTDNTGKGACSLTPNEAAGGYPLGASFAETGLDLASADSGTFTVKPEETALTVTSPNALAAGTVTVKAALKEDGTTPIAGRTVSFSAGSATASGTTDANDVASATLSLTPGSYSLGASFTADGYYAAGTASQTLSVYQPTQFVIWGGNPGAALPNVTLGTDYTFWGAQWAKQVSGGTYTSTPSFKGYAATVSGSSWTTNPGATITPPATVPSVIGVLVATQVPQQGSTITGNVAALAVLKVDNPSAYAPDSAYPGSGVLVATLPATATTSTAASSSTASPAPTASPNANRIGGIAAQRIRAAAGPGPVSEAGTLTIGGGSMPIHR